MEEKEATSFIPQVTQTNEQLFYYTSSCLYPNDTLMAPKLVLTYILWSTYAWNIHLKTNRRVRYNFLQYFIQFENHPEAKLMWRKQLSFPLNFFSPFLSFLAILSSFQACQVNCRTADFSVIEISWETRRKKNVAKIKQQKDGESRGTEVRNVDKWTCYPTRPWHRSESPAATLQQSWTSLHASQFLFSFFPVSPFCLCILHLAVNFPSAPETACYLNCCSVRQNTLIS